MTTLRAMILLLLLFMVATTECKKCAFKAIFNFGDSNTDTGGFWAAFPAQAPPHGMTYFNKPVGRATDGRVVVDFLGEISLMSHFYYVLFFVYYKRYVTERELWFCLRC